MVLSNIKIPQEWLTAQSFRLSVYTDSNSTHTVDNPIQLHYYIHSTCTHGSVNDDAIDIQGKTEANDSGKKDGYMFTKNRNNIETYLEKEKEKYKDIVKSFE